MANGLLPLRSDDLGNLPLDSYTAQRLSDATPEHLHLTSRRCFIGPIPKGWIDSHKKSWVTAKIKRNYRNRSATFTASENTSDRRRVSGLRDASPENIRRSFRQPQDAQNGTAIQENEENEELQANREDDNGRSRDPVPPTIGSPSQSAINPVDEQGDRSPIHKPHLEILAKSTGNKRSSSTDRRILAHHGGSNTGGSSLAPEQTNAETASSTTSLLRQNSVEADNDGPSRGDGDARPKPKGILSKVTRSKFGQVGADEVLVKGNGTASIPTKNHIRFDVSQEGTRAALLMRARLGQSQLRHGVGSVLRRELIDGSIVKMEKMLVRIDVTNKSKLPDEYDENSSQGVVSTTRKKWREYMIVVRQNRTNNVSDFVLQAYKTRVIPASEKGQRKKPEFEIHLESKQSNLNMYSSLDKSLVLWTSGSHGTLIYTLQCRTTSSSVEWLTFLRGIYGLERPSELMINIPGVDINLRLQDPFKTMEGDDTSTEGDDDELLASAMSKEEAVAPMIISRCVDMLKAAPETANLLETWQHGQRIGLAWKRYDRLEWIHGIQEKQMFGTMAMIQSHDLELRPKQHYPTNAKTKKGKLLTEPPAVEGFLIQLTSQKGKQRSMGRSYFSRLYFSTFDQFLFFAQPKNSEPPAPPADMDYEQGMSSKKLSEQIPIIYAVNPFPLEDERIKWTTSGSSIEVKARNEQAEEEARRREKMLQNCEGFINLCDVVKVRKVHHDADEVVVRTEGDSEEDSEIEDAGIEDQGHIATDDAKTFELVLKNGLIIRLRAYDKQTKKEWKKRLRALVKYWRWRNLEDVQLFHQVRSRNLHELQVDEEGEALVGQFARKWELTQTFASAEMYNFCGLSGCRTISLAGPLYAKPRLHGNFTQSHCLLIPGHILLFENSLRATSGKVVRHVHHVRRQVIDLVDCYLYTGLLTEGDLLYHNTTFDANSPGHHALPRMWPEDGWDNWDEDIMTCFVLWKPAGKSWFRDQTEGRARLKRVSTLGKKGNRVVFRARSRAERDRWVLAISKEIERQAGGQEVRVVGESNIAK